MFREEWIQEFVECKENVIAFAYNIFHDDDKEIFEIIDGIDEDKFQIKFGGFLPQHSQVDPKSGGAPTERGIVDMYGNTIVFDPTGDKTGEMSDCLSLRQP